MAVSNIFTLFSQTGCRNYIQKMRCVIDNLEPISKIGFWFKIPSSPKGFAGAGAAGRVSNRRQPVGC